MTDIRYYLDENLETEIAVQLQRNGIDSVHVRDLGLLGKDDASHLERAREMDRVLCTYDRDFIRLAKQGVPHAGIVIGERRRMSIGLRVNALIRLHQSANAEQMQNLVQYI